MEKAIFDLLREICPDFAPYTFLKTDLFKGKIIGAHNLYYKKGDNDTEGVIFMKRDIAKFNLDRFPYNFVTYTRMDKSQAEYGWTGEILLEILKHVKNRIDDENKA